MHILELPAELFDQVVELMILTLGVNKALELRVTRIKHNP
jgi:hypothetical protein